MEPKNIGTENVQWDLSAFYKGLDDPQLDADVAALQTMARKFQENYKGKLAEKLGAALTEYAAIQSLSSKVGYYLFLRQATDVSNAEIKAKSAAIERILAASSGEHLTFFDLELVALDDAVLAKVYESDPVALKHKPLIDQIRIFKPHFLVEAVESALTKRSPFGPHTWSEYFDEVENDLPITFKGEKKMLEEVLHVMSESKDAAERAEAMKAVNDGIAGAFAKYAAQTLYVTAGAKSIEDKERGYRHPMDYRNKDNMVSDDVVDALHRAVTEHAAPLAQRHYRLKAKLLGLPRLAWSDRNAPMPFADTTTIPFEEAKKTVKAAYESFSPTLAGIVQGFYDTNRIDAPVIKGKQSGAFNASFVRPDGAPEAFTLLNYLGSSRDVMTLAHELGHGVHAILAGKEQGPLMYQAPMAYCETASVFGEMTAFTFLKNEIAAKGDVKSLLALTVGKIEDFMNTVVRQISFSNFERRLHGMDASYTAWGEPKRLSAEELNAIWLAVTQEFYGAPGDIFTYENAEHLWSYVSHFHRPFYVYSYAFGELLTQSLYAARTQLGDRFEPLYLDLLRAGATKDAVQLLAPFGLDPRDPAFWKNGIDVSVGAWIAEAEKLAGQL